MRKTDFHDLGVPKQGKVRDIYDLDQHLLFVATDRLSAFDVVMVEGIPGKGRILNQLSAMWFRALKPIVPNHFLTANSKKYPPKCWSYMEELDGRSMLVKKATPLLVECVVRGYLSGSGWKEYQKTQSICGIRLRSGMVESEKLDQPIFTPSTKVEQGLHDENINFLQAEKILGHTVANFVKQKSLELYRRAQKLAEQAGIIIADTKFEFGIDGETGGIILIDELLTPDSSRFWDMDTYLPGGPQDSFDKQFVRDYLEKTLKWDKKPPVPHLPPVIVEKTAQKYQKIYDRLYEILEPAA